MELYPLIGYTLYMYLYGFMIPFYSPQRLVGVYEYEMTDVRQDGKQ